MLINAIRIIYNLPNLRLAQKKQQGINLGFSSMIIRIGLAAFLVFSLGSYSANAQSIEVSGTVTDASDGAGLPGVNIILKGSPSVGTSTNSEGFYSLTVPSGQDTLIASFIGYITQEVPINGRTTVNISLSPDVQQLEDVVVIGYGTQQKKDVTGVVESVDSDDFNTGVTTSPDQLIAGKVAGVSITSNSGEPGGQNTIRIRGGTSINASNEPLFVIDGVPIDNSANSSRNPLNFLNPEDIQNVTVLKDASATAIYGSRGANGVIVISTKGGIQGQTEQFSYRGTAIVSRPIENTEVLNAEEFRQVVSERAPGRVNLLGNADTNWQDLIQRTANGQTHTLSMSGGAEDIAYRASVGFMDQEGILETSETDRLSASINYNQTLLEDRLSINANVKGSRTKDRFAPGGLVGNAVSFAPTQPVLDPGSEWAGFWEWDNDLGTKNPVAEYELIQSFGDTYRSVGNINFDYTIPIIEGLSTELNLGYDVTSGENRFFAPNNLRSQFSTNGEIRRNNFNKVNTLLDAYVNYIKDLGSIKSSIEFLGGYSYQEFNEEFPSFTAQDLSSNVLGFNSTAPAQETFTSVFAVENRLISFFGRANYSYDNKYLLTATVRRDGSSRFGPENRWGTFPSAALGWRISEEPFFENLLPVVSDLKLRIGAGITGNQEIGDFQFLSTFTFSDNQAQVQFGDDFITTLRPSGVDPTLKWEETKSFNVGLDYELLEGRFNGSLEYYYKKTEDLLFTVSVPAGSNLTNRVLTNIGSLENEGVEFVINGAVVSSNELSWNLGFNIAANRNEILKLTNFNAPDFEGFLTGDISGGVGNQIQILRVGESANAFFVFKHKKDGNGQPLVDGVDHNGDGNINLADIYEDTNSDGIVNDRDKQPTGSPAPDVTAGLTSQLYYKNFDLAFTLRTSIGNEVYNNVASNFGNFSRVISDIVPANMHSSVLDNNFVEPQLFSDVYVEDGSYLRMDNITLGYTFNGLLNQINNLRVFATGQNLFVLTGYSGLEPEVGRGIDDNIFPRSRTFIFGLNVDF